MPNAEAHDLSSITARWNEPADAVELIVNHTPVPVLVHPQREAGMSPFAHRFLETGVKEWLAGYRDPELRANTELDPGELELTVCPMDADILCGSFAVRLSRTADRVIWSNPHWAGDDTVAEIMGREDLATPSGNDDPLSWFPPKLEFASADYDAAMASVQQIMEAHPWPAFVPDPPSWFARLKARTRGVRCETGSSH
ncbi:hypothetical protein [Paeniglutamicibacter sp. NPDC091659]|uniref:hypothetical protein n=1 Tax=Paeniglutamicibacter sp. NPDC091659 TaxID=3364389 RepID=UPI003809ABC0